MELERLRGQPSANESAYLMSRPTNSIKVICFNIQSFLPHFDVIQNDPCLNNADVICLVETWTTATDVICFKNFEVVGRLDSGQTRRPSGILVLKRSGVQCTLKFNETIQTHDSTSQACVVVVNNDCYVISLYLSPRSPLHVKKCLIERCISKLPSNARIVVTGDFNESINMIANNDVFSSRQITSVSSSQSSTYLNTQIDLTFSNTMVSHVYYHSFLSYHRPQVLHIMDAPRRKIRRRRRRAIFMPVSRRKMRLGRMRICCLHGQRFCTFSRLYMHNRMYLRKILRKRNRLKSCCHNMSSVHLKLYALKRHRASTTH